MSVRYLGSSDSSTFVFFNMDSKRVLISKTIYHIQHHLGLYRVVSCCEI